MNIGEHHTRDDRVADEFLAVLPDLRRPETQGPVAALTPDDEAMLRELERSDGAFIDHLVDEVWDDANRLFGDCLSNAQEPEEQRPPSEAAPRPCDPAERLAREIVSDWAWAMSDSDHEAPSRRWLCRGHSPRQCHSSPDYELLVKVLDLDAATRADAWWWPTAPDGHTTCRSMVCYFCLTEAPGWTSLRPRKWSADCDASACFLAMGLAPQRGSTPSRLWHMIDQVAKTFRVETYDRENVLRILLGDFGKGVTARPLPYNLLFLWHLRRPGV
jgi:hypothetical protein